MTKPDAIVVGGGIIGLSCATAISRRGLRVLLVGEARPGEASAAAAGMLAPSVEKSSGPAHRFACAARDFYPAYLEELTELTGIPVALNRLGILQVAVTEKGVKGLKKTAGDDAEWLERAELAKLEPALTHALGAMLNPSDGSVNNVELMSALGKAIAMDDRIESIAGSVIAVGSDRDNVTVTLHGGGALEADHVVLAPGAWAGKIDGAPALDAVQPSRGQLLSYDSVPLRHVAYGPRGYLVPRGSSTIAGSTMENAGFVSETTPDGVAKVRGAAGEIVPSLAGIEPARSWAGLRPVTPDMLPILGADPNDSRIVYACGHSRNGILMAPLTGETVAALITGEEPLHDLSQFHPGRF